VANSGIKGQGSGVSGKRTLSEIPIDYSEPVEVIKGFNRNEVPLKSYPDEKGNITIKIRELERLEIHFFDPTLNVEPRTLNISLLPPGSTLDTDRGIFYWQPGPGYIGDYWLIFIVNERNGIQKRKNVLLKIFPKFSYKD
jgi:hypothetical protein